MRGAALMVSFLLAAVPCLGGSAVIVDGATKATVLVPSTPAQEEAIAARVLSSTIAEMTGRGLDIVREGESVAERLDPNAIRNRFKRVPCEAVQPPIIHLGLTSLVRESWGEEIAKLDQDGFIIRGLGDDLVLAGPTPWASGFAAYAFLEDHCGVRWYLPGELGTVIPRRETLVFEDLDDTQEPVFLMRKFSGVKAVGNDEIGRPWTTAWQERNRLRGRYQFHHNLWRLLDPTVYGKEHADWYPLIDGERRPPKTNTSSGWQPCMTNPGAIQQIADNIIAHFDEHPEANSVSIAPNDGGGYCNCPECLKLSENVGVEGEDENRSRLFWQFANRIAELVAEKHPENIIGTLAYSYSRYPYEGLKLHPNIMPFYVGTSAQYRDAEARAMREEHIAQWGRTAARLGIYEWYFGGGFSIPVPYTRIMSRSLKYSLANHAQALYSETYPNWGLDGYKVWIFAKLLWDPERDPEELIEDFCRNFFAEAYEPMRKYIALCERQGEAPISYQEPGAERARYYFFRSPHQFLRYGPEVIEEALECLEEGRQAARSDVVRRRVKYIAEAFGVTRIMAARYQAAMAALEGAGTVAGIGDALEALSAVTGPEYDLGLYHTWVLADDPWQCREPESKLHGPYTRAHTTLASTIATEAMNRVRGQRQITPALVREELEDVAHGAVGGRELSPAEKALLDEVSFSAGRVAVAARIATPPVIDGKLDDACWEKDARGREVLQYGSFFVLQKAAPARFNTRFWLTHDTRRIYVAAECEQESEDFMVVSAGRDGRVWHDDSVEFLLNKPDVQDLDGVFQLIVNTESPPNLFDMYGPDAAWDGDIEAASTRQPGRGWTTEFSVPFADIEVRSVRDRFLKMNLVRNVKAGTHEYEEISNWFPTPFGNRDVEARGWLVLE